MGDYGESPGRCTGAHRTLLKFLSHCVRPSSRRGEAPETVCGKLEGSGGSSHSLGEPECLDLGLGKGVRRGGEGKQAVVTAQCYKDLWSTRSDMHLDGIAIGRTLGRGNFGCVYQAVLRGTVMAIKIINMDDSKECVTPTPELMLTGTSHPNLVQIFGVKERQGFEYGCTGDGSTRLSFGSVAESVDSWCRSSASSDFLGYLTNAGNRRETWIFMEYCDRGALWEAVKRGDFHRDAAKLDPCWVRILSVAAEIIDAVGHLHAAGIIHGDLRPQNVLLQTCEHCSKGFITKVGDFGLSKPYVGKSHVSVVCHGAVDHMPPEVLKDGCMSTGCDIFSFGVILWELCTGQKPFKGLQQAAIVVAVVEGHRPSIPVNIPSPMVALIQDCWQPLARNRPSCNEIVARLEEMCVEALRWEREQVPRCAGICAPPVDFLKSERYSMRNI